MSMHIPICQWSYLWVISASQRSIYSELFLFISQWHPEHNAHSVSFSAMAQFVDTNWGGKTLHFEGHIYTKLRDGVNGFQFWRCQNRKAGCLARATSEGSSVVVRKENNHPPNLAQTITQLAIARMRKRVRDESISICNDQYYWRHLAKSVQNSTDSYALSYVAGYFPYFCELI